MKVLTQEIGLDNLYDTEVSDFSSNDGTKIYFRVHRPKKSKKNSKIAVIHHGFGEHGDRYNNLLEAFQDSGYTFYIHDARGHGKSGGQRGHVDNFFTFADDLDQMIRIAQKTEKVPKVTLIGHSMGGLIAIMYAEMGTNQGNLKCLVSSSPALKVHMNMVMNVKKVAGQLLSEFFPSLTVPVGLDAEFLSHDPIVVEQYKKDKLVFGSISTYMGKMLIQIGEACIQSADNIRIPTYIFHGTEDFITNCQGSIDFYNNLVIPDKKINLYDKLYHETMNEYPQDRDRVLSDLRSWLDRYDR